MALDYDIVPYATLHTLHLAFTTIMPPHSSSHILPRPVCWSCFMQNPGTQLACQSNSSQQAAALSFQIACGRLCHYLLQHHVKVFAAPPLQNHQPSTLQALGEHPLKRAGPSWRCCLTIWSSNFPQADRPEGSPWTSRCCPSTERHHRRP